eukprot:scaffold106_cov380-Prasinococcus_capsulatus_cf.AAC.65
MAAACGAPCTGRARARATGVDSVAPAGRLDESEAWRHHRKLRLRHRGSTHLSGSGASWTLLHPGRLPTWRSSCPPRVGSGPARNQLDVKYAGYP